MLALTGRGFSNPVDLTLARGDVMYVINRSNAYQAPMGAVRVTVCTTNTDPEFVSQFGGFGEEDGQFIWPTSIDRDSDGNFYISDEHRHDVQVFDKDGNFVASSEASVPALASLIAHPASPLTPTTTSSSSTI